MTHLRANVLWVALALAACAGGLSAQQRASLTGRVTDEGGAPLDGVQVVLTHLGTSVERGTFSREGRYLLSDVRAGGPYRLEARMIGYGRAVVSDITLADGETRTMDLQLVQQAIALDALEVFATVAQERETPVAFTDVKKVQLENQLGSRELPLVLNVTPSVYATQTGGGAGDARVNVRGFSQRNTAVMINGVPVNDMENGWVYWSNWDGVGDATSSVQLQRGLSAVNLATPSIGGTLNIITDPTQLQRGVSYKQEFGSGDFLKETLVVNSGAVGRFAFTGSGVRKTGNGLFENNGGHATYTDAWAYYLASSFDLSERDRFELYAVGAPQKHGQNLYLLNVATLDQDFARELGFSQAALDRFPEAGRRWSPNVNRVSPSYQAQQYASTGPGSGLFDRHGDDYINERENYFHKPQVNLNWHHSFNPDLKWSTVAYYSGGNGGGTGTFGSLLFDSRYRQRFPDWDATIARNQASTTGSTGILRNSVNDQWTIGAISKLRMNFSAWTAEVGVDARTAEIEHYREVRDLLGGAYFRNTASQFWSESQQQRRLGDKIDYHDINTVDWIGGYAQAERATVAGSFYGVVGVSRNEYQMTDYFTRAAPGSNDFLVLSSGGLSGWQAKGGAMRNLNSEWSVFANGGYVSKIPIVDAVIDDVNNLLTENPENEKFISFDAGVRYRSVNRAVSLDLNVYDTQWQDRTNNYFVRNIDGQGNDGVVTITGLDQRHSGIEVEGAWEPLEKLRLDAAASVGNWRYLNDVTGRYIPEARDTTINYAFFLDGIKVADAPQTQFSYGLSVFPVEGLYVQAVGKTFDRMFAEFDPFSRTNSNDRNQSWETPGYTVFDLHAAYRLNDVLPVWRGGDVRLFLNVFNLFDKTYIQDAVDNSGFNGFYNCTNPSRACTDDLGHDAESAEVFLGLPRTFNFGFQVGF
jgi:hypothetical protein